MSVCGNYLGVTGVTIVALWYYKELMYEGNHPIQDTECPKEDVLRPVTSIY